MSIVRGRSRVGEEEVGGGRGVAERAESGKRLSPSKTGSVEIETERSKVWEESLAQLRSTISFMSTSGVSLNNGHVVGSGPPLALRADICEDLEEAIPDYDLPRPHHQPLSPPPVPSKSKTSAALIQQQKVAAAGAAPPIHRMASDRANPNIPITASLARRREEFFHNNPNATASSPSDSPAPVLKTSLLTSSVLNRMSPVASKDTPAKMSPPVAPKGTPLTGTNSSDSAPVASKTSTVSTSAYNGDTKRRRSPSPPPPTRQKFTGSTISNGNGYSAPSAVRELHGYVGFANIPNQVYRKAIKQGFDFTLMVVGQSGLGKSTFINSLFLADIYGNTSSVEKNVETVTVEEQTVRLVENGVNLSLTLVDTPGFGDQVDNSNCLKPLDVEFMKRLHDRVNIIPVIGKADTMTPDELLRFKHRIIKEIKDQGIKIYQFPDAEEGEEDKEMLALKERVPFAVVGSNIIQDAGSGKKVRCRKYSWGVIEVENLEHNDFVALRNMIIRTHMIDLVDVTRSVHYENFRYRQLMTCRGKTSSAKVDADKDPFTMIETEKKNHEERLRRNQEDMEKVFQEKVREKQNRCKQHEEELRSDKELLQLNEKVSQFQAALEAKRNILEQKQTQLEDFKKQYPQLATYASTVSIGSAGSNDTAKKNKVSAFFK